MNLLIIEQPLNNRGDESAHKGFIKTLTAQIPDIRIRVFFYERTDEEINQMRLNYPNIEYVNYPTHSRIFAPHRFIKVLTMLGLRKWLPLIPLSRAFLTQCKWADHIVVAPGGVDMGGFQIWPHIAFIYLAQCTKKSVSYFARSIGPFPETTSRNRRFRRYSLELLHKFAFLSLRDKKSATLADSLNIPYTLTADSCFLVQNIEAKVPADYIDPDWKEKPYIVFVPNSLAWNFYYKGNYDFSVFKRLWLKIVEYLAQKYPDHAIVMLPQTVGNNALRDGYTYFTEIKQDCCCPQRVFVLSEDYGSDVHQAIIRDADLLIGARYHSVIFAINQNAPFVSLSYEHKMSGILQLLGLEAHEVNLSDIFDGKDAESGILQTLEALKERIRIARRNPEAQAEAHRIAFEGFKRFEAQLN